MFQPWSLLCRTKHQPLQLRAYPPQHCSGAPSEIWPSIVRSHLCTQNLGLQKLSYQIKRYLWANMNSLSGAAVNQIQGNSCLYSHILDWLQWFQTLACFSLQCIPYHYHPERPLHTLLSCLLAPALLYKVIWKIIPKRLRILRRSCLKHHSVFQKIFMPLQTKKKVSHYTSNLTAFFGVKTIN